MSHQKLLMILRHIVKVLMILRHIVKVLMILRHIVKVKVLMILRHIVKVLMILRHIVKVLIILGHMGIVKVLMILGHIGIVKVLMIVHIYFTGLGLRMRASTSLVIPSCTSLFSESLLCRSSCSPRNRSCALSPTRRKVRRHTQITTLCTHVHVSRV